MLQTKIKTLDLQELSNGLYGITPSYGSILAEAAAVCFNEKHQKGVEIKIEGIKKTSFSILWKTVTEQMKCCWNDEEYTTEHAAYAVAFLLISELTEFTVIERSRKGTGFDYWLGKKGNPKQLPFQDKARLEVSGIRNGNNNQIEQRVTGKIKQISKSNNLGLKSYIIVVEFSLPISRVINE